MERDLKWHENKLLRKTNFVNYSREDNIREIKIIRKYRIQDRQDYRSYNKICNMMKRLAHMLSKMDTRDPFRNKLTDQLLDKAYGMGLINTKKSLEQILNLSASAFCRRRLAVILVRNNYCENLKQSINYIKQGHLRIGPNVVNDPALLVTRNMEDFITWTDNSKVKGRILKYNDIYDDYDFLE
eukprot:TRINITY_DN495_c0_g1_i1.p1 TRINITY_DN495_c0_g1~~TRINITY_DN495_c0_g1_i1.p1  ORF type:complete len:184 (-),score=26.07 TRINITY_DN495_c0_g1_i1:75-626(-)